MSKRIGLAARLIVMILTGTSVIFGATAAYNHFITKRIVLREVEGSARNLSLATVYRIQSVLAGVQKIPANLADVVGGDGYNQEGLLQLLRDTVTRNPEIYGSAIAYEPHGFAADSLYFAPYCYREEGKPAITYLGGDDYRYFYLDWYQIPTELGRPSWSEPYYDEGGGNILMATYSVPFFRQQGGDRKAAGVVTADISLAWLKQLVESVKIGKTGYAFLVSANGVLVTHPDPRLIIRESLFSLAEERHDDSLRTIGKAMIQGKRGFVPFTDFHSRRPAWLAYEPLPMSGWSLGVVFPADELFAPVRQLTVSVILLGAAGFLLLGLVIAMIARSVTRPLTTLALTTGEIARGNLDIELPTVGANDEVGDLTRSFGEMKVALKEYIADLAETTAAKERIESELKIARTIQMSFLPKHFPPFPDKTSFDIFARLEPARHVGGDLYDFFLLDETHLLFSVGDVSDKGVPAALFMAVTKTLLKGMAGVDLSPAVLLEQVNNELCLDNDSAMFVTLFCGVLDLTSGEVVFANGGHNPPVVIRGGGEVEWLSVPPGLVLGGMEGSKYRPAAMRLAAGDQLLLYTDGVTEARSEDDLLYSDQRLLDTVRGFGRQPVQVLVERIMDSVQEFAGQAAQADDITLLAIEYRGRPEGKGSNVLAP